MTSLELLFWSIFILTLITQTIFTFDDLFIDLSAFFLKAKPTKIDNEFKNLIKALPEKRIAILIANWKEDEILYQMISGNISSLQYENYTFFIGVYPNDEKTWSVAKALEAKFSQVQVIVNDKAGPTSKGQLLNLMTQKVVQHNQHYPHMIFDLLVLQDSEDILHPFSLKIFNYFSNQADFVQIPVFSFPRPWHEIVGSTYIDEFAESHTKDLLVRQKLGAAIPSCGVGTCISFSLVSKLCEIQNNQLLNEKTLTEDYQLGLISDRNGFKTLFVCLFEKTAEGIDWIATREYFPNRTKDSIKQKTRWTLGIAFQGLALLGWQGSLPNKYFLFRDRKAPLNSFLLLLSTIYLFFFSVMLIAPSFRLPSLLQNDLIEGLIFLNLFHLFWRIFQRSRHVWKVYSFSAAAFAVLRWPLGNLINFFAGVYAMQKHVHSVRTKTLPKWDKTQHQIPSSFGTSLPTPGLSQGSVQIAMEAKR